MFFSNSVIIVRVDNLILKNHLNDFYFFEENGFNNFSRKFYSINFHNEEKNIGEIHYTNSYEYGKMNVISFLREENLFFLFISSVQHIKFFKKILMKMLKVEKIDMNVIKIPLIENPKLPLYKFDNFEVISADGIYGIIGQLKFDNKKYTIKLYTNGLIIFPMTNNKELVEEVIKCSLKIIQKYEK